MTETAGRSPSVRPEHADYLALRAEGRTAIYKATKSGWDLLLTEKGDAEHVLTALTSTGATITERSEMLHVLTDGDYPQHLASLDEPTAEKILRAKAGLLRRQAEGNRLDAAYGGEMGDRGASRLEAVAAAYEDAIVIYSRYPAR